MAKFIVFEGNDCSGKTTAIKLLADYLNSMEIPTICIKFPDREGVNGEKIDKYLKNEIEMTNDEAYQMFKENREPYEKIINDDLNAGITIICDRYLYSGIVYSHYNLNQNVYITKEYANDLLINEYYMPVPDLVFLINGYHPRNETLERYEHKDTIKNIFVVFSKLYELINVNYKIINNHGTLSETKKQLIEHYINL